MKFPTVVLTLTGFLNFLAVNQSLKINPNLIIDFLNKFNVNRAAIFYCEPANVDELQKLSSSVLKFLSFLDISSESFALNDSKAALKLDHRQIGIIFDLTCNETEQIFEEFSRWSFFNASYNWLMVAEDFEESLRILEGQNINLDAEISLAIYDQSEEVKIYDIYNPNSRTNGKIISTPKGTWNESKGMEISLTASKFERRKNLNGVIINAGIAATSIFMGNRSLVEYLESELKKL
jgi:hypothetical protein